jgi:hypothetical protein
VSCNVPLILAIYGGLLNAVVITLVAPGDDHGLGLDAAETSLQKLSLHQEVAPRCRTPALFQKVLQKIVTPKHA